MQRKLTVILSADVVGYSALMERDEAGTMHRLRSNRASIFDPRIAAHGGRIFKLMGDGALVEFASVISAIQCAQEIQEATEVGTGDESIHYRIGINLGEVIVEAEDIYGDGVNVATRLQSLAPPGGVAVSRLVRDQAAGKIAIDFEDLGEHTVKNIERPVHVFTLRLAGAAGAPAVASAIRAAGPSICVLPFSNMSGDPEQEYFSDGITEDIITDLSKISALSVVSRNTSFTYKGKEVTIGQVARQLKVTHVLEGSVRKSGNRVRITAQLIEGASDNHLWAERYDRDLNDIFSLQDEISEAVVDALKLKLLPTEKTAIEQRSTTNPEAYKYYLMARKYNATGNTRHRPISIRLCQRAIEIDPTYARAWALLAICKSNDVLLARGVGDTGWPAAERALALEPNLAEAHAAKGRILCDNGNFTEGLAEHRSALQLDSDNYEVNAAAARCFIALKRYDDAIASLERAAAAIEADFWSLGMSIQCYEAKGDTAGAESAARRTLDRVEKLMAHEPDHGVAMGFGVTALTTLGDVERAKEWMDRALLLDPDNINLRYNTACSLVRLGLHDEAIELLERVLETAKLQSLRWFETDNSLDAIREDPRYHSMVARATKRLANSQEPPAESVT